MPREGRGDIFNEHPPELQQLAENAVLNAPFRLYKFGQETFQETLDEGESQWKKILQAIRNDTPPERINVVLDPIPKAPGWGPFEVGSRDRSTIFTSDVDSYRTLLGFLMKQYTHRLTAPRDVQRQVDLIAGHEAAHDSVAKRLRLPTWYGVSLFRFFDPRVNKLGNPRSVGLRPFHHTEGSMPFWSHVESLLAPNPPSESDYRKLGISAKKYDLKTLRKSEAWDIVRKQIDDAKPSVFR